MFFEEYKPWKIYWTKEFIMVNILFIEESKKYQRKKEFLDKQS